MGNSTTDEGRCPGSELGEGATHGRVLPDGAAETPLSEGPPLSRRRIVGYLRVSTEKQDIGVQDARAHAYGIAHDVDIVALEHDYLSGKNTARPGLKRALAMLERGEADGLLVMKMDRLTRSVRDLDELVAKYFTSGRFTLLSMSDAVDTRSAAGRLVLMLLMCVSQWEREVIGERTKVSLDHKRATGGGTPRLEEGPVVARMRELVATGMTYREVAAALTAEGIPTLKGGKWAGETVRKVLARTAQKPIAK